MTSKNGKRGYNGVHCVCSDKRARSAAFVWGVTFSKEVVEGIFLSWPMLAQLCLQSSCRAGIYASFNTGEIFSYIWSEMWCL